MKFFELIFLQKNGVAVSGGNKSSLYFPNCSFDDSAVYRVFMANSAGAVWSQSATLSVRQPPTIASFYLSSDVAYVNQSITATVAGLGTPPLNYTWLVPFTHTYTHSLALLLSVSLSLSLSASVDLSVSVSACLSLPSV